MHHTLTRLFKASLFSHAKEIVTEASVKYAGMGVGFASELSKKNGINFSSSPPLLSQVFHFALVSSSLMILSVLSMIG